MRLDFSNRYNRFSEHGIRIHSIIKDANKSHFDTFFSDFLIGFRSKNSVNLLRTEEIIEMDPCISCTHKSKAAQNLKTKELEKLGHSCNPVNFDKGDMIMIQDALSYNIVYVKEGLVKVHVMGPEREQILKIAKGPCYLGIPTTVGARVNQYSVTAILKTNVCFIGAEIFKEFITENGHFAYEIILEMCKNELYNFKKCINQLQKQGPGKIAEALLYFSENIFDNLNFELPLTRNELGDLTCTSRETVSRILTDFDHNELIKVDKKQIKILNQSKLRMISEMG